MTPGIYLLGGWLFLSLSFAFLWLIATRRRDASHVDVGWALGLGYMAAVAAACLPGEPARRALLAVMACGWSVRLGGHLFLDRVQGKSEDGRYAELRAKWGAKADFNFFFFFQAQALLDVLLALPFIAVAVKPGPLGTLDWAGLALCLVSVGGETLADRQLAAFRLEPANKGKTCRAGLWSWSRHPNYFFEWTHWLAYAVMVPADWRVWTSPALMLFFLLKVTGIPATEKHALRSRGDDYRRYQKEVSMFIPLPPRRSA